MAPDAAKPKPERRPRPDPATRALRRRIDEVEAQIHELETRLTELGQALADPALYSDGARARTVAAERKTTEERLAWLMLEWEELSASLAPGR